MEPFPTPLRFLNQPKIPYKVRKGRKYIKAISQPNKNEKTSLAQNYIYLYFTHDYQFPVQLLAYQMARYRHLDKTIPAQKASGMTRVKSSTFSIMAEPCF
jgi:hypothetical protein